MLLTVQNEDRQFRCQEVFCCVICMQIFRFFGRVEHNHVMTKFPNVGLQANTVKSARTCRFFDAVPAKYWPLLFYGGGPMYPVLQTSLFQPVTLKTARRGTRPVGRLLPFDGCVHWTLTKVLLASTASCEHRELHATRLFLHLLALVYMWIHRPE